MKLSKVKPKTIFVILNIVCIVSAFIVLSGYIGYKIGERKPITPIIRPIEKNVIDTLYITNDRIKYKIKYLDSIKYDTIEKVYKLNDTATVELFYKLCSE